MFIIHHLGHGPIPNEDNTAPLQFISESEAREYLAACSEIDNIGIDWRIKRI